MKHAAPWHARLARILGLLLPVFLIIAALGTKYGAWDWRFGLVTLFGMGGAIWMGATVVLALISIIVILISKKRVGIGAALVGLLIPLGIGGFFAPTFLGAGDHPIHDMATDTADPPQFSAAVLEAREKGEANPLNPYDMPLKQTEQFASMDEPLASQTTAQIIAEKYAELEPLSIGETSTDAAVNALQLAMADMGFSDIRYNPETATVEGVAETFWFGFKDDVAARVSEGEVDFRSVSRVGQSDLGANAKRIMALREKTAEKLSL